MVNDLITEIVSVLQTRNVDIIKTIDISQLSKEENRGYRTSVLIGISLSPDYIYRLSNEDKTDYSEFAEKEHRADELAGWASDYIIKEGYNAFAQSEENLLLGLFDKTTRTTPLPHK